MSSATVQQLPSIPSRTITAAAEPNYAGRAPREGQDAAVESHRGVARHAAWVGEAEQRPGAVVGRRAPGRQRIAWLDPKRALWRGRQAASTALALGQAGRAGQAQLDAQPILAGSPHRGSMRPLACGGRLSTEQGSDDRPTGLRLRMRWSRVRILPGAPLQHRVSAPTKEHKMLGQLSKMLAATRVESLMLGCPFRSQREPLTGNQDASCAMAEILIEWNGSAGFS
jgi:hypothetical protein